MASQKKDDAIEEAQLALLEAVTKAARMGNASRDAAYKFAQAYALIDGSLEPDAQDPIDVMDTVG